MFVIRPELLISDVGGGSAGTLSLVLSFYIAADAACTDIADLGGDRSRCGSGLTVVGVADDGAAWWLGLRIERGLIEEELGLTPKWSSGRVARLRFEEREERPGARAEGTEVS